MRQQRNDCMKIALINSIMPQQGSGDGMTEYTYQLYKRLKKTNEVDIIYSIKKSKRNDVRGLVYTYFLFSKRIKELAKKDYDIIHITNQEMGFAARILKENGSKAKIIVTVHDLMRLKQGFNKGLLQNKYDKLVKESVKNAFNYSDYIIFSAKSVEIDAAKILGIYKKHATILLGPRDTFVNTKVTRKNSKAIYTIGYIGALSHRKNVIFILRTALQMRSKSQYRFMIYGSGPELQNLQKFKSDNNMDNVFFMGFAPEKKLLLIYDSFDLFFYPTLEEGSSLPMLDAQARGLPVVILRNNMVDKPVTKYCFKVGSEKSAAGMIERLLQGGYSEKQRSVEIKYAKGFSWDNISSKTMQVYSELLNQSNR